jgi:hydroxymethylbilane synthase
VKSNGTFSVGTLDGRLSRAQTHYVINKLQNVHPKAVYQTETITDPTLNRESQSLVFNTNTPDELEMLQRQLLKKRFDMMIIAADDMLHPLIDGLQYASVLERNTPYDALLHKEGKNIDELENERIGVLSMRSQAQINTLWPDLRSILMRGGAAEALDSFLQEGVVDGLIMPAAVAERLDIQDMVSEIFYPEMMLPGFCQGVLAIVCRESDEEVYKMAQEIHSTDTSIEMLAEMSFRERICPDQNCPIGVMARVEEGIIAITGVIGSRAGGHLQQAVIDGPVKDAKELGIAVAEELLTSGESLADLLEADFPDGLPVATDDDDDFDDFDDGDL